jgi:transcriptional regulator with XRE-family HTH domain
MINPELILERVRQLRKQRNYTREQFAQKLNMSASAYSKIESGQTALTIERLNEIATALGVEGKVLFFEEGEEIPPVQEFVTVQQFNERMGKIENMRYVIVKEVNMLKHRFEK